MVPQLAQHGTAGLIAQARHGSHRLRHQGRIVQRCELDSPHAVVEHRRQSRGGLQRQARLARSAGAGQRQQTRLGQQPPHLGDLTLAADETGELDR